MRLATRFLLTLALVALWALPASAQTEADSVQVTFQLDATSIIAKCQLGGNSTNHLEVRGNLNNWGHNDKYLLTDPNNDKIYTLTVKVHKGELQYKYNLHGTAETWENGDNHVINLTENVTLPVATFNKDDLADLCGTVNKCVEVLFQVNMEGMILSGSFDQNTQQVTAAGNFNGWNADALVLEKDNLQPNVWTSRFKVNSFPVPSNLEYKYIYGLTNARNWEGGDNHVIAVTGNETVEEGCLQVELPVRFFNNVSKNDLFSQATTLKFEVDARPGFYHFMDSTYINVDAARTVATRSTTFDKKVYVNGAMAGAFDPPTDWISWGKGEGLLSERTTRMLYDDGTHGDVTANDTIFTMEIPFAQYKARNYIYKLSLDGYDNENPAQKDHYITIPDQANPTVRVVFGAPMNAEGKYLDGNIVFFNSYIDPTQDGTGVTVVRRPAATASEDDVMIAGVSLSQNYPNPSRTVTTFEYTLAQPQHVSLKVYDLTGRLVATVVDGVQAADKHQVKFDTQSLPSGVYVYQLKAGGRTVSRMMTVVR